MSKRWSLLQCALTLFSVVALPVGAQQAIPGYPDHVTAYDPREVAGLPRYCIYTQGFRDKVPGGNDRQEIDYWYSVMGQTFHAMHHYCWGLMKVNRALSLARDAQTRLFYLNDSVNEFNYVLNNTPEDFVLLPEILTKKARSLILAGRGALGIVELERAIALKPDYWPPSVHLSDYYREAGDLVKAREILEQAIARSPGVKQLKDRLADLDKHRSSVGKSVTQR
jgi:tetratricopeptide (TPR) repeat protein